MSTQDESIYGQAPRQRWSRILFVFEEGRRSILNDIWSDKVTETDEDDRHLMTIDGLIKQDAGIVFMLSG